jgi:hypothetical protein
MLENAKMKIYETMFACANLLACQPTLRKIMPSAINIWFASTIFVVAAGTSLWFYGSLLCCPFANSTTFQCEAVCPFVSKHLHQACFEGFEPVDRQNRCSMHNCVRSHFPVTILYTFVVSPMYITCSIYL